MTDVSEHVDQRSDVVVVGAGPTGLLVAAELALGGVRVEVLERLGEPDQTIKAGSVNVATAEILDRRGLLPAARQAQRAMMADVGAFARAHASDDEPPGGSGPAGRRAASAGFPVTGHFAAMMFRPDLVDQDDPELRAHTAIAGGTVVPQRDVEAILGEHAARLGVTVRRGVEVTDLHQDDAGVSLTTSLGELRTGWVVGADGGRSRIRKLAGIGFPGTDPETTGYQAVADLEGEEGLGRGWNWGPHGVYSHGPIPGRILTVQFTGAPADRDAPVTAEELQASIRLVSGVDVTVRRLKGAATRWTDNARQAEGYRRGRVLLAGDAAHVHSPFSGQGLNLGVGDAVNLGWKLAATVAGWAPEDLLDTYSAERHPVGAWVLDWTRAQVALMRGDVKTGQLRAVVQQQLMGTPQAMTRVVKLASGIAQRYTLDGSDVAAAVDLDDAPPADTAAARVGRLLGDVPLSGGARLSDHAHQGGFLLLDRTPEASLARALEPWRDRVRVVSEPDHRGDGPVGVLVRPDGVVAWAAPDLGSAVADDPAGPDDGPPGLSQAVRRWVGAPTPSGPSASSSP